MQPSSVVLLAIFVAALGGAAGYFWAIVRHRHNFERESARLQEQFVQELNALQERLAQEQQLRAAAESRAEERDKRLAEQEAKLNALQSQLAQEQQTRTATEARLQETQRNLEEQRQLLQKAQEELSTTFKALSVDALKMNNETFAERIQELLRPLSETLQRYERQVQEMERNRLEDYGSLSAHLAKIAETYQELRKQTGQLVTALRTPQARGRWGEITLRRVVELAGMSRYCDFEEQPTASDASGVSRPDLTVHLPGGRLVVVDAKTPLSAYLDAVDAVDENVRQAALQRHALSVRQHLRELSRKAYWDQFSTSPDFVVLFLPGESFFSAALEVDRTLIEDAISQRILIATPTTLIALLRAVAYGWQQHHTTENAQQIVQTGKELIQRLGKFAEHLNKLRTNLERASQAYNEAIGSWTGRVLPSVRRFAELEVPGADAETLDLHPTETALRPTPQPDELPAQRGEKSV